MLYLKKAGMAALLVLCAIAATTSQAVATTDAVQMLNVTGSTTVNLTFWNGTTIVTHKAAAGDYHLSINGGASQTGFCSDLFDQSFVPESWTATVHQTSAPDGLITAASYYSVPPHNINAVDYIAENYTKSKNSQQAAAQLAIWDLILGGQITKSGTNYSWSSLFSETGVPISSVYLIEKAALTNGHGPQGSDWLQVVNGSELPQNDPRPQDMLISTTPELSSIAAFLATAVGVALLALVRSRKSKEQAK